MNKKTKAILSGIGAALISGTVAATPDVATKLVYDAIFSKRFTTYQPISYQISDFSGLKRDRHTFYSNDGQLLVGYVYYRSNVTPKGLIVLSHGFGSGGQRTYMDVTNYFTENGFYVFAYDATANDESEGDGIAGFPQGTIDLSYALNYVKTLPNINKLPLFLFGHSWGGYNVSNVLNYHTQVKAVCSIAGFNKSSTVIEANAHKYAAGSEDIVIPYIEDYEEKKFEVYATSTAISGFKSTNAGIFIIHSGDDATVPYTAGYKLYWEEFKNNKRFKFRLYESRGHGTVYYNPAAIEYTNEFYKNWNLFLKKQPSEKEKLAYLNSNLNRDIWNDRLDKQLFKEIVEFYESYL